MALPKTFVVGAAALLVGATLFAAPSTATPAPDVAAVTCRAALDGVSPDRHLLFGDARDGVVSFQRLDDSLEFTPAHMALASADASDNGRFQTMWANGTDGSLRLIDVEFNDLDGSDGGPNPPSTTVHTEPIGFRLHPRLFAFDGADFKYMGSHSSYKEHDYLYRVSASGYLYRDTTYFTGGRFVYGRTVNLGHGLAYARTLAAHTRIYLHGERTDVLFATTKYGRLYEITVPIDHPSRMHATALATSGFARYDGLGAQGGTCTYADDGDTHHVLIGVDSTTGTARSYAVRTTHDPQPSDVTAGASFTLGRVLDAPY